MGKSSKKKIELMLLAIVFTFVGIYIALFSYREALIGNGCYVNGKLYESESEVDGYEDGKICFCDDGKVKCNEQGKETDSSDLSLEDFIRKSLNFSYRYVSDGISSDIAQKPLQTQFRSVKSIEKGIEVVLEQGQLCTKDGKAPVQVGLYNATGNTLTVLLAVNTVASIYTQPCTVSATFRISPIDLELSSGFKLQYMSEDGALVPAQVCIYNSRLYNDGDNYSAIDSCNLCSCDNGISRCSNDRVCESD